MNKEPTLKIVRQELLAGTIMLLVVMAGALIVEAILK
jgi:hypothetical protein